ncbi:MAG TPA: PIN domain-containing protein [Thermoanaerobaculia bacterium]|jgi:predicted nucleic acid-binding protein
MTAVFADTSYWIALLNPQDSLHPKAIKLSTFLRHTQIITSEMVLVELLNDFSGRGQSFRRTAVGPVEDLRRDPQIIIVPQSSLQFQDALSLYADRSDKAWGLTDCASFRIMDRDGLTRALTHDRHFGQAGFQALLRD